MLGVLAVAARYGSRPAILASVLGVAAFDYFFSAPRVTFAVEATEYLIVDKGKLAGTGAHSDSAGDAPKGLDDAAHFKKSA